MFGKIKDAMQNKANEMAAGQTKVQETIQRLAEEKLQNASDYTYGVAQIETEDKGGVAVAARIAGKVMVNWKDYLVAVNNTKRELLVFEIGEDEIVGSVDIEGDFTCKKDTMLGNELKNTLKGFLPTRQTRSGDRYGRDEFTIKSDSGKTILLVGNYVPEGTNYAYDNTALIAALKKLA